MMSLPMTASVHRPALQQNKRAVRAAASPSSALAAGRVLQWMSENGAPEQGVTLQTMSRNGQEVDVTVASRDVRADETVLRVPEDLIVTLDRVFEDGAVAELLTTNKLSELACLTLYLSYEKKRGEESFWYPFIKELDKQGGRGPQGAKTPLLWRPSQIEEWLAGSPVVGQIEERLKGIQREYEELDTVWFMAGSLFKNYPFEPPTEQFSLELFTQAFAAVQSSVVHLQGVPLSKRFALVPLGPPLLSYSSTAKSMLRYNSEAKEVQLTVDRAYAAGEPVLAWCGPQPNSRLLINYGVVDDTNPYDKLPLTVIIPSADPLYRQKRARLADNDLSTQHTFQLSAATPLPPQLLPFLRLTYAATEAEMRAVQFDAAGGLVSAATEGRALAQLANHLRKRLAGYRTSVEEDEAIMADPTAGPRQTVAARLLRIEKLILQGAVAELMRQPGAAEAAAAGDVSGDARGVRFI